MFENIIVGVDGRQGGRDALALGRQLAHHGATATLVNVYAGSYLPTHLLVPGRVRRDREAAEGLLARERAGLAGVFEEAVTQSTSPARGLHELAEARQADLLVLGSCHRGGFGRATLGSDTRAGVNGAPCAVAVAPTGYAAAVGPMETIGVACDGSRESAIALAAARTLAARTNARVRALQIVTAPAYPLAGTRPPVGAGVDELLRLASARMAGLEGIEAEVRAGVLEADLIEFSRQVDLLVVGLRAYGPAMRLVEGSTALHLLANSRAPLLILPRGAQTSEIDSKTLGGVLSREAAGERATE